MSEHTLRLAEDISKWMRALEAYVKETNVSRLDLSHFCRMSILFKTVLSILKTLPDSQVTELILNGIDLSEGKNTFREYVKTTGIKKLSIRGCYSHSSELLHLAEILNDTKIVEFYTASDYDRRPDAGTGKKLASYLLQSRLAKLSVSTSVLGKDGISLFAEGLASSNLTSLHIIGSNDQADHKIALASLFPRLPQCQIIDLNLENNSLNASSMMKLSQHLAASKIEKLSLSRNKISDAGLDVLAQSLVNSNVTELDLRGNYIHGSNNFGHYLQKSKIRVLNLSENCITNGKMFPVNFLKESSLNKLDLSFCTLTDEIGSELIKSLRSTKLKKLYLQNNFLGHLSTTEFAAVLKDTILEDVDLSSNDSPNTERFNLLGKCVKESKLKRIALDGPITLVELTSCLLLFKVIKNSPVLTLKLHRSYFLTDDTTSFVQPLTYSTFTGFELPYSHSGLKDIVPSLALNLKYTSINHLHLSHSSIGNKQAQLLAEHLNETKIVSLDLSYNHISNGGAQALARCCPQTSLIHLNLAKNDIDKEGLETLANHFAGSLITTLDVQSQRNENYKYCVFLIEKILLENRVRSHKLVLFFNQVLHQNSDRSFCFHRCINDTNIEQFLEDCLEFSKSIMELPQPAVVSTLLEGGSLPFSRDEIISLLFDKFPQQLVEFIATSIEADAWQHVKFLMRAEELGLVRIVEWLLVSRPLFMIDVAEGIMHPDVYGLLVKYKQPICNEAIEPGGIERIREYFTVHSDLEGAEDVVQLLSFD